MAASTASYLALHSAESLVDSTDVTTVGCLVVSMGVMSVEQMDKRWAGSMVAYSVLQSVEL